LILDTGYFNNSIEYRASGIIFLEFGFWDLLFKSSMKKLLLFIPLLILLSCCQPKQPVLYMMGDSTMADKPDPNYPERGWGQLLPTFFDSTFVIENHAKNGRSTRSFIYEGRWDSLYAKLKPGDFLVIQFGHNDGSIQKTERYATPVEYRYNLKKFVKEAQNKGAYPILCTPVVRRNFEDGKLVDTHGEYPGIVRELAAELKVPFIDMHRKTQKLVAELGEAGSLPYFLQITAGKFEKFPEGKIDNTHFSEKGAIAMASLFVEGVKEQHLKLEKYLKPLIP
jgi:DNA sulfur modification protein DndE